jgi:glutathione S-transferase
VRKVRVCAHELGLADQITLELLRPSPTSADPVLSRANPLSKIPALVLPDGSALYDSPVICEYLDTLAGPRLIPASGPERWRALRVQALADGLLDAGILVFYERLQRPPELHWAAWLEGQTQKAQQALDALDAEVAGAAGSAAASPRSGFGEAVDIGQIAVGCAVGWLLFRQPFRDVLAGRPALAAWYARFAERASMRETEPHA